MSLVGRHIGRYRILEQLGQGGMSVVYKGLDTTLEREVAVKVLHPHLASRLESRKRLEREAKAVARLHHPNILEVFDYSAESGEEAYLVTEIVRGKTLREFINEEALQPPELAAMVMFEIASALAHAHDAGVLHRDLKPENVMVRDDGVLKLMDFGIAKILDHGEKMTMTGALVGSPAHMAPEIIEGEEAGAEADIFSLGTMLYLFATGKLPFTAPNTTATLKKILDSVYDDPRQVIPSVSDELAEIIAHCLQRQPKDRFANAGQLRDALGEYLASMGLTRSSEELAKFFLDPRGYRKELTSRVTAQLLTRAQGFITEKKPAKAMSALNQALAHDPQNARAVALLNQLRSSKQREARLKQLRKVALVAVCLAIVTGAGVEGYRYATKPPPFAPKYEFTPSQVTLTNVQWPEKAKPIELPPEQLIGKGTPMPVKLPLMRPPETVEVAALVRPYGFLQVDSQPVSTEALARHLLKLTPGKHKFTVTCDVCEAAGRTVILDVKAGDELPLIAPLKPSLVSFQGWPDDARVRVGALEKSVRESQSTPFRITTPPQGNNEMRHRVPYVVTVGGVSEAGEKFVVPGKPLVIVRGAP